MAATPRAAWRLSSLKSEGRIDSAVTLWTRMSSCVKLESSIPADFHQIQHLTLLGPALCPVICHSQLQWGKHRERRQITRFSSGDPPPDGTMPAVVPLRATSMYP